ncbi:MAG: DUF5672 family protein [Pseudomonadota bacterium]
MIQLKNVTLWGCCWSDDSANVSRTVRVLHYMQKLAKFGRVILFSHLPPDTNGTIQAIQIPKLSDFDQFNVFVNACVPHYIESDYAMSCHEDGFIIDPTLWKDDFLKYDYIGAPWADGVVGNGGFSIESNRLMRMKTMFPFSEKLTTREDGWLYHASDVYVCRVHRKEFEDRGIKFAPREIAVQFSSEQIISPFPSLGFHGRNAVPHLYEQAWARLIESEK